jgi:hypothetical protein
MENCPFCEGSPSFCKRGVGVRGTMGHDEWWAVSCNSCGAMTGSDGRRFRTKEDAAKVWNQRADLSPHVDAEHIGWAREWEGDSSDLGKYIIECCLPGEPKPDDNPNWFPLYTSPPPSPAVAELVEVLSELHDIVDDIIEGNTNQHSLDSFTLQPARAALAKFAGGGE